MKKRIRMYTKLIALGLIAGTVQVHAVPEIEEAFDYPAEGANVAGNDGGTGFTGAWANTRNSPDIWDGTKGWGGGGATLNVNGTYVAGNAWSGIARPIGSTLLDANLLDDGATLWFGAQLALVGQNTANADINIALTNAAKFNSGSFADRENLDGAANEGIGVTHSGANIRAVYWDNAGGRTESAASSLTINGVGANPTSALVVGKIEWGVDGTADETLTLYYPDGAGGLTTPIVDAWAIPALNQSAYTNLAIQFKDSSQVDEIRFGATSADVLVPTDNTAPDPNPMTFASLPAANSSSEITMTATTATDASGVEYLFTETSGNPGGDSSVWQSSATYTDSGLASGTMYTYTVTARDTSPAQNVGTASAPASATTDAVDNTPPDPNPMTFAIAPAADGETSITMTATTATDSSDVEYLFTETSGNPGGDSSVWQDSATYTDSGLTGGTEYTYTVTARDKSPAQNEGTASAPASATTDPVDLTAPTPDPMTFASAPAATGATVISMTASTATDDIYGVEYYFTETSGNPGGADSGWQDSPTYTDSGLDPATEYTYTVKARDKSPSQNETVASSPESATTNDPVVPALEIYEGFDYAATLTSGDNLAGSTGGFGFSGAWVNTRNTPDYVEPGNAAGTLQVVGGKAQGNAWSGIARPLDASLADAGLLSDTATLWFSAILDLEGQNTANADINIALTNAAKFNSADFGSRENLDGAGVEGIGVTHSGGNIRAVYWDNAGGRTESGATSLSIGGVNPASALVVGKIEWGGATETITLYAPDANLNLGTEITSLTTAGNLTQSAFNNLAIQFKDTSRVDEIRFGATFEDVAPNSSGDYGSWAALYPGADLIDPDADLDGDGLTNDDERLFGLDPTDPASQNPYTVGLDSGAGTFSFTRRDPALTGLATSIETSTDLQTWMVDTGAVLSAGATGPNGAQTVGVTLSPGLLSATKLFARVVQAEVPPLLSEDFESGDGGFTVATAQGTAWALGTPDSSSPGGAVSEGNGGSTNAWGTGLGDFNGVSGDPGQYADPTGTKLRSAIIDLTGLSSAELTFAEALDLEAGDTAVVNVIDDTTDAIIAAAIYTADDSGELAAADWSAVGPIDLTPYVGQAIRLEWSFDGFGGATDDYLGWYVDDVVVTGTP